MGCSASRPNTLFTTTKEDYSSSHSHSHSSSRTIYLSSPLVHHPPLCKGDTHHLVSLTSTTYGSLSLIDNHNPTFKSSGQDQPQKSSSQSHTKNTSKALFLADPQDPSSPDSVINTWELMDGLEDIDFGPNFMSTKKPISSPHTPDVVSKVESMSFRENHFVSSNWKKWDESFRSIESPRKPNSFNSMDCNGSVKKVVDSLEPMRSIDFIVEDSIPKPLWQHLSEESFLAKMDPNVVSSYRQALSSRQLGFNQSRRIQPVVSSFVVSAMPGCSVHLPGTENRVVLYFTSLMGIRRTYEDCCTVRSIFRGFRVPVDERDISMDSTFRKELQRVLGEKAVSLPQIFIRGRHVGGADYVKQLHENGELARLLEGFPVRDPNFVCESCGDLRFVPCPNCNGSRKVYEEDEGHLRRCPDCNENGLIRCPGCCY